MIIENAYIREIVMNEPSEKEFINQFGVAVDMLTYATESSYDQMDRNQFFDWATDLWWIKESYLIFIVKGKISNQIKTLMNEIISFWKDEAEYVIAGGKPKYVHFIILD